MHGDQAFALRELVRQSTNDPPARRSHLVVVTGGESGVGSSSIACGLAATQADQGLRTLLIDVATNAGATEWLGHATPLALPDVVQDLSQAAVAIQPGPGQAYLLPNHRVPADLSTAELHEIATVVPTVISKLAVGFDTVIVDCGNLNSAFWKALWDQAEYVLVVTTTTNESVMAAYMAIKANAQTEGVDVRIVVNGAETRAAAEGVWKRIANSAQRFLNISPGFAGYVPHVADGSSTNAITPALQDHATARLCLRRIVSDLDSPSPQGLSSQSLCSAVSKSESSRAMEGVLAHTQASQSTKSTE